MSTTLRKPLAAVAAAFVAMAAFASPAMAADDSDNIDLNAELEAGALSIEWQAAEGNFAPENLADVLDDEFIQTGVLPDIEIVDERGTADGFTADLEVTDFANDSDSEAPVLSPIGTMDMPAADADVGELVAFDGPLDEGAYTFLIAGENEGMGNNSLDLSGTSLFVDVPVDALAGTYTAVATASVIAGPAE